VELTLSALFYLVRNTRVRFENGVIQNIPGLKRFKQKEDPYLAHKKRPPVRYDFKQREEYLRNEIGQVAFEYISNYAAIDSPNTLVISTTTRFNIDAQIQHTFECIINVRRVNDFRYINKYFESVNAKLTAGGIFIDFFETTSMRKKRILAKFPPGLNYLYYTADFIVKRVFPKFMLTKKIYFILTRGENRVLSKAETFGRLYSCGFEILDEVVIDKALYFVGIKVKEPLFPQNPSYGPLIGLERIGKGGKTIKVFKMRTMHPFAEYLQDYVYTKAGLQEGGKFKDDFRVTTIGIEKPRASLLSDGIPANPLRALHHHAATARDIKIPQQEILIFRPPIRNLHDRIGTFICPIAHQPSQHLQMIVWRRLRIVAHVLQ
jgi:hypothetical protein